jgi:hypothetical protein
MPLQRGAAIEQIQYVLVLPSTLADDEQARGIVTMQRDQTPPQMRQQQVVLARLDRANAQKIRAVASFRCDVRCRPCNAQRRYVHRAIRGQVGRQRGLRRG